MFNRTLECRLEGVMLAQMQSKAVRATMTRMLDGAKLKKNRPRETMDSSVSVFVQVIMLSLYDFFVVSGHYRFWYVYVEGLCRGNVRTSFGLVSPYGRPRFLFNFGMSRMVSFVEAALKRYLGQFPLKGGSFFAILVTECL